MELLGPKPTASPRGWWTLPPPSWGGGHGPCLAVPSRKGVFLGCGLPRLMTQVLAGDKAHLPTSGPEAPATPASSLAARVQAPRQAWRMRFAAPTRSGARATRREEGRRASLQGPAGMQRAVPSHPLVAAAWPPPHPWCDQPWVGGQPEPGPPTSWPSVRPP